MARYWVKLPQSQVDRLCVSIGELTKNHPAAADRTIGIRG
ncbi:hypothetical protein K788_0003116 [Paraburkholderia caribensis MBA4]|uniref:Uncharacterized protein n=1 Tax=Paraburkholderia caribensis MBA4 TaxID=1323664 RepID=A0A0N7JUN2_9BURK|nr:hypothetical protein K788_0003116 [Paraburkholderia caribensis MBA4]